MTASLIVDPAGMTVAVTLSLPQGGAVLAYADAALTTPLAVPATISTVTPMYLALGGSYVVSVKLGGTELGPFQAITSVDGSARIGIGGVLTPALQDALLSNALATASAAAGGVEIDYAERASNVDVQAIGAVFTEIDGLRLIIPPQATPWQITLEAHTSMNTGSAATGTVQTIMVQLADFTSGSDAIYAQATKPATAGGVASRQWDDDIIKTRRFPPSTTTRQFRVNTRTGIATPAGWTNAALVGGDIPNSGSYPPISVRAVTLGSV